MAWMARGCATAPTAAAIRLRQRNRLADLDGTIGAADLHMSEMRGVWQAAREVRENADLAEREREASEATRLRTEREEVRTKVEGLLTEIGRLESVVQGAATYAVAKE